MDSKVKNNESGTEPGPDGLILINNNRIMKNRWLLAVTIALMGLLSNACNREAYKRARWEKEQQRLQQTDSLLVDKQFKGVDFTASGQFPAPWTLDMKMGKRFILTNEQGTVFNVPALNAANQDTRLQSFPIVQDGQKGQIDLWDIHCAHDANTDSISILFNGIRYTGCGRYTHDNTLHNTWILEAIDDKPISTEQYGERVPTITLDLIKRQMRGNDGCNQMGSSIAIEGTRIRFGAFFSTRMACMNLQPNPFRTDLLSEQLVDYYFKDGKLILYLINDSRYQFYRTY